MAVNVHFMKKAPQLKTLITPSGAKPKLLSLVRGKLRLYDFSIRTEQVVFGCD